MESCLVDIFNSYSSGEHEKFIILRKYVAYFKASCFLDWLKTA